MQPNKRGIVGETALNNFRLLEITYANAESRELIKTDGQPYWPFQVYMRSLHSNGRRKSTRISYATDVAYFLDYFIECSDAAAECPDLLNDPLFIVKVFQSWPPFMSMNEEQRLTSDDAFIREIGRRLKHPKVSAVTINRKIAAVRGFVEISDKFQATLSDRKQYGILDDSLNLSDEKILPEINKRRELSTNERRALIQRSMLAGVVNGGAKYTTNKILRRWNKQSASKNLKRDFELDPLRKAFPPDRRVELINAAKSKRDKVYLALLAASGLRGSEARQLLWQDIDVSTGNIWIIPPWERRFTPLWDVLPTKVQEDIPWKGRETEAIYLMEPYASIFWEYLAEYRNDKKEWSESVTHPFVFCQQERFGYKPLLLSSPSTISDIFKNSMQKLKGLPHYRYAAHSLRHSYGLTCAHEFGIPLHLLKKVMGHAMMSSTEVYVPTDRKRILEIFTRENMKIMGNVSNMHELSELIELHRYAIPAEEKKRFWTAKNDN